MRVLIIGGNRFFGKKLAQKYLRSGTNVTLLNRGNRDDGLGERVSRLNCDRTDWVRMTKLLENESWDLVHDQMCFDYHQAKQAVKLFSGKTQKYIFTSTVAVYDYGKNIKEDAFNPRHYQIREYKKKIDHYGEAKRQAEVAFYEQEELPVTSVRFPFVFGQDDFTERFLFHLKHIKEQTPISFIDPLAICSMISADFAAEVLYFLGQKNFSGPINGALDNPLSLQNFLQLLEEHLGKKVILDSDKGEPSPYNLESDLSMDCSLLSELGLPQPDSKETIREFLTQG